MPLTAILWNRTVLQTFRQVLWGRALREAGLLGLRLVGARGMSVVSLAVSVWLVDIQAFAEFGIYQTLAALAAMSLFLRYDAAIVSAADRNEAHDVVRLCAILGGALWLVFSVLALTIGQWWLMSPMLAWLLPASLLMRGLVRLGFAQTTRDGDFKGIGRASLVQSVCQPLVLLVLVLGLRNDAVAFAMADIVGHATAVAYLAWRRRGRGPDLRTGWSAGRLLDLAARRRSLPLYNLPSTFCALAFILSPLLILPLSANADLAGHVALAYRMFDVPTQIVAATMTPIFLHRLRPSGEGRNVLFGRRLMMILIVPVALGFITLAGALVLADPFLAGTKLANLADIVPAVAAFHMFLALAAPLNESCSLYPQQRRLAAVQAMALLGSGVAALFALWGHPEGALVTLAVASAARAVALGELLRTLSLLTRRVAPARMREATV